MSFVLVMIFGYVGLKLATGLFDFVFPRKTEVEIVTLQHRCQCGGVCDPERERVRVVHLTEIDEALACVGEMQAEVEVMKRQISARTEQKLLPPKRN